MPNQTSQHSVLLVDDEAPLLQSLKFSLKSSGIPNVETCSDSTQVLDILEKSSFSLIILDNMMPGISGMELLPQIHKKYPETPVIMLTAIQDTEVIVEAMKKGAFDYLVKPVNKKLLVSQVNRALAFYKMHKENTSLNSSLEQAVTELKIKSKTQEDLLAKLTKSTYQLRTILEALPAVILLVDAKGNIAQCNDQVKKYFQTDFSEVVFQPFDEYMRKIENLFEDKKKFTYVINQLKAKPNSKDFNEYAVNLENRLVLGPPSNTILSVVSAPISPHANSNLGALWVFRDVTDVIRSEEQLQTLVNASPVPLLISNLHDGRFLYANSHLANIIGVSQEELMEKTTKDFYYDPNERDAIVAKLMKDKKVQNQELKVKVASGEYVWAVINLVFAHLKGQDVIVGGVSDISQQKKTIEALEKTKKDLMDAQSRLVQSEKMASLGNLVAGIAHEINNPVGAVSSSADVATKAIDKILKCIYDEGCKGDLKEDANTKKIFDIIKDCHKIITDGCSRIAKIVKNLKNFSRIDEAEYLAADIHEGLDSTLALVNHQFKNRITVVRKYGDLPLVDCYPNQLNQVFMNMLVNAGQAISDKGTVTIETLKEKSAVIIKISDTGKGIPELKLSKVFDPGYTTKGVGVGTGLGLSISYNIIEKHKGSIDVISEIGKGSTFIIKLPIS